MHSDKRRALAWAVSLLGACLAGAFVLAPCAQNAAAQQSAAASKEAPPVPASVAKAVDAALPSAKDLLERNDAVMGSKDAWLHTKTRLMKGVYQTEDGSAFFGIEILQKSPNKSLYKLTFPRDIVMRDVCDGHTAWLEDPRGGYHEYVGAGLASRLKRSEFLDRGKVFLLAATGKVLGTAKVGAHNTYVVEFSPEKNLVSRLYFDVDTAYLVHTEDVFATPEGPYTVKLDMDDFREVDGMKFAFRIKRTEKGAVFNIHLTQVKNDVPVDDSVFFKPESSMR